MKINSNYDLIPAKTKPTFKRNWQEHASWGVRFAKETQTANFKLFTFPDAKMAFVEIAKKAGKSFGNIKERIAQIVGLQGATYVASHALPKDDDTQVYKMENKGNGIFEAENIPAEANAEYRFVLFKDDRDVRLFKDPYTKKQTNVNGWSQVLDQDNYEWKSTEWMEGNDPRRIVRRPDEKLRGLENLFIEEINIPTLSEEGSFDKAMAHIDNIAERGIATAIEIMPVENTNSLQWGYDGVDKFAVNEKMGGADKLKELIDYAHSKGLNVIMDIVPNHMGPDGNYLKETGPYLGPVGEWGDLLNYEGQHNRYVRDYIVNTALWWVNEFKVDGLRLDMTQRCNSDILLNQITTELNYHNPDVFLIAEDARDDNYKVTAYNHSPKTHEEALKEIDDKIDAIANKRPWSLDAIGFDSEWDFKLMHSLMDHYIDGKFLNLDHFDYTLKTSNHRVKFAMSHDEIGNKDGTRLIPKIMARVLNLFENTKAKDYITQPFAPAHLSQKIAEFAAMDMSKLPKEVFEAKLNEINSETHRPISAEEIQAAFDIAKARHKVSTATMMTIPGPKMYFQGDDSLSLKRFKFFRELSSDSDAREKDPQFYEKQIREKGYIQLEEFARPDSIITLNDTVSEKYKKQMLDFHKDLTDTVKNSEALTKGDIVYTYKDYPRCAHIHHLKMNDDEILVIKNFGEGYYQDSYSYPHFPDGSWKEIFNSDDTKYGGSGLTNTDKENITAGNQSINLAPNSVSILKKVQ